MIRFVKPKGAGKYVKVVWSKYRNPKSGSVRSEFDVPKNKVHRLKRRSTPGHQR